MPLTPMHLIVTKPGRVPICRNGECKLRHDDRNPGTWNDGDLSNVDAIAAVDRRREARWSYMHPRQHFAYSRLKF